jgi:hypothetical protein
VTIASFPSSWRASPEPRLRVEEVLMCCGRDMIAIVCWLKLSGLFVGYTCLVEQVTRCSINRIRVFGTQRRD